MLLENDHDLDCASALIYESAKQCVNAVANRNGYNPGTTAAKIRFLRHLAEDEPTFPSLLFDWRAATALHNYADREHLSQQDFMESWERALAFIDQMLLIYARNG